MTDYEQWKQWLDRWNIDYWEMERSYAKFIVANGTTIEFDVNDNFIYMTSDV